MASIAAEIAMPSIASKDWVECGHVAQKAGDNVLTIRKAWEEAQGSERGLASVAAYDEVELTLDVNISADASFLAKVHQIDQIDQSGNSYHLFCHPQRTYLAMHNKVFQNVGIRRGQWITIGFKRSGDMIELRLDGRVVARVYNGELRRGYCFVGVKGGEVLIRNLAIRDLCRPLVQLDQERHVTTGMESRSLAQPEYQILFTNDNQPDPAMSIITTVYDRVTCLKECLRSVNQLRYRNFQHIVVSDHPPKEVVDSILRLVKQESNGSVTYADLAKRHNNWGIAPGAVGLVLSRGNYVCFLSDDNGYTPGHFDPLIAALDRDKRIGFAYSSCQYAGRRMLRSPVPRPGGIDLGQPLFRKELFTKYLNGTLPFNMFAWDWYMIEAFMRNGVTWKHIDRPSFLFRLAACKRKDRA